MLAGDAPRGSRETALVLVPNFKSGKLQQARSSAAQDARKPSIHSPEDRLLETTGLVEAIDLAIAGAEIVTVAEPKAGTLFGSGKVEEIKERVSQSGIQLVVVDHTVTPVQQRNLEKSWGAKVLDRTGLILEIFGRRARTKEGRLQVELAQLTYQKGRLVRAWSHLERQRGGGGFLGGPGEAQIELDRRMIEGRILALKGELAQVVKTRALHRASRRKVPYPIVAIVGYTNAGKSTLFNRITGAKVLAMDQVFATLDPTLREVRLAGNRRIILSDTVGFISDLPTMLVAAFRATLEEVIEADLILHVRDISHPETEAQARDVEDVLASLGVELESAAGPIVEVWNKADLLPAVLREDVEAVVRFQERKAVLISAVTGEGIEDLLTAIDARLGTRDEILSLRVPSHEGRLLHWVHENTEVLSRQALDDGTLQLTLRVTSEKKGRLLAQLDSKNVKPTAVVL